ncbi:MAG: hypothetical protein A2249_01915 [Candidatus Jacksonbacteria bacterium RIFOXYA2_FULL_44_7]|uniref:Uncharacterized protein n=1 Tax=Candidatus Jacksonbacteria bacterium RIFCSPLOWO2_02_FULL_44_20 TaxID=1798460 RepID=A0A1G2A6C8_9BACT|nr:MAG: hypothetical protein UW39_C0028G0012 [Parcubacteria group bacterium GW2011_GWC2_44_17]KKT47935.1 MAG: hypothetical protein UW40_C0056G0006 [Parcubacteria group bacterium GW2011_GWF2_44_17]OGY72453.1 MAG: hypothetical protein A3H61_05315 [Candidatus Jacksonbacteria bacterium RIFCSPLOWO2_02_FULL_44_20]OGY74865.1 MAG: hypothetical protein A3H07_04750 [Candidatus Jacksonbacteria bacterium RIFCSPLOWO2_12_FULL_44_15b]OGY76502.1 MAG: hypothetical protein A2249_01915 [Candidatus Jacksonbacteria
MVNNNNEYLKSLPMVEVSFQDQFCGCEDEIIKTPWYILSKLNELGKQPKIGDKILLYEKDVDENNQYYYLCNTGEVIELNESEIKKYLPLESEISWSDFCYIDNQPIMVKIDKDAYLDLSLDSEVFVH